MGGTDELAALGSDHADVQFFHLAKPLFALLDANLLAPLSLSLQIEGKDHFKVALDSFQAQVRTESMVSPLPCVLFFPLTPLLLIQIRAAHSLLALSHTLKLLHFFADTATPAAAREARATTLEEEIAQAKKLVKELAGAGDVVL